jgi:predicted membrane protein
MRMEKLKSTRKRNTILMAQSNGILHRIYPIPEVLSIPVFMYYAKILICIYIYLCMLHKIQRKNQHRKEVKENKIKSSVNLVLRKGKRNFIRNILWVWSTSYRLCKAALFVCVNWTNCTYEHIIGKKIWISVCQNISPQRLCDNFN